MPRKIETVGVVVPTLGLRKSYIKDCIESILEFSPNYLVIVTPDSDNANLTFLANKKTKVSFLQDPGTGLAGAINLGLRELSEKVEYVTWLGDDDSLYPEGLSILIRAMNKDIQSVSAFGVCDYIDENSKIFWTNRFGALAVKIMKFGPNKIPQPGSIVRSSAIKKIGFLNEELKFAFDLEMFIKLSKIGKIKYVPVKVAKFRWHSSSLSAGQSEQSILESSKVRISEASPLTKPLVWASEQVHVFLALRIGNSLDRRKLK